MEDYLGAVPEEARAALEKLISLLDGSARH